MKAAVTAEDRVAQAREAALAGAGWAELFSLPLRGHVWRGGAGGHSGHGTGSSLDFQDHRSYLPGDDPRHINWQAYARTGQYTMKLFREEVRPLVDIVLDASPSMFFRPEKAARAVALLGFALEAARRAGAAPRTWRADAGGAVPLESEAVLGGTWAADLTESGPDAVPAFDRIPLRPQSLRVLISDLLYPAAEDAVTAWLAAGQARAVILAPCCAAESDPDWDGNMDLVNAEDGAVASRRIDPGVMERYRRAYAMHFALWKEAAQRRGIVMARVPAEPDGPAALQLEALRNGAVETWA